MRWIILPKLLESPWDFSHCQKLLSCRWERQAGNDIMVVTFIPVDGFESSISTWKKRQMQTTWLKKQRMSAGETELPPKAICRTLLLFSPTSFPDTLQPGSICGRVWMWPRSRCGQSLDAASSIPSTHMFAEGASSSCHPILNKTFPSRKGKWEGFVWLWTHTAAGWLSLLTLSRCVSPPPPKGLWITAPRGSGWHELTGWRCPVEGPWTGITEQTNLEKNITAEEKYIRLSSCFQDTSKIRSLDGVLGVCVSLKSLQSPCYQEWAPLTNHPGSKHLVRNSWDIQCLLIQDPALGFSQVLASFLPPCLANSAFAVKAGQRLGYFVTNNIYSW